MPVEEIVVLYVECISTALPFTLVFYIGDYIVTKFLTAALGGKLRL